MGYLNNNILPTVECRRSATNLIEGKKHQSASHLAFRQPDRHWKIHPIERSCEMERSCENAWIARVPVRPIPSHIIDSCRQMKDVKWDIREKCKHAAHCCPWSSISPPSRGQSLRLHPPHLWDSRVSQSKLPMYSDVILSSEHCFTFHFQARRTQKQQYKYRFYVSEITTTVIQS